MPNRPPRPRPPRPGRLDEWHVVLAVGLVCTAGVAVAEGHKAAYWRTAAERARTCAPAPAIDAELSTGLVCSTKLPTGPFLRLESRR